MNEAILMGNLTRDPDIRYTSSGKKVATISMATNRNVKDDSHESGFKSISTYHTITLWEKMVDIAERLQKGDKIIVAGRIDNSTYESNGSKRFQSKIVANMIQKILTKKNDPTYSGDDYNNDYGEDDELGESDINIDDLLAEI